MEALNQPSLFVKDRSVVVAALHLPPSPAVQRETSALRKILDFALRNAEKVVKAGIPAMYIQDIGDLPVQKKVQPHTVAFLSVVGAKLREEFPGLALGVCTMSHGAREPLAIAQAIDAQFVRIKVFTGAMVKSEGILEGCAQEAISYRTSIGAEHILILADVYDRTGIPLGEMPLVESARAAVVHNRADALILTGLTFNESIQMLKKVREANLGVPMLLGGGADEENIADVLNLADGVIVSSSFKPIGGWTQESMLAEWDLERMHRFMQAATRRTF